MLVYANDDAQAKADTAMAAARDVFWQDVVPGQAPEAAVEWMDAEDTLFYLYTSGSTGKPKGVVHTTGGFMVRRLPGGAAGRGREGPWVGGGLRRCRGVRAAPCGAAAAGLSALPACRALPA